MQKFRANPREILETRRPPRTSPSTMRSAAVALLLASNAMACAGVVVDVDGKGGQGGETTGTSTGGTTTTSIPECSETDLENCVESNLLVREPTQEEGGQVEGAVLDSATQTTLELLRVVAEAVDGNVAIGFNLGGSSLYVTGDSLLRITLEGNVDAVNECELHYTSFKGGLKPGISNYLEATTVDIAPDPSVKRAHVYFDLDHNNNSDIIVMSPGIAGPVLFSFICETTLASGNTSSSTELRALLEASPQESVDASFGNQDVASAPVYYSRTYIDANNSSYSSKVIPYSPASSIVGPWFKYVAP